MDFKSLMPFGRTAGMPRGNGDFDPLTSLRREMDRMFEDFGRGWAVPSASGTNGLLSPRVDIAETEKGLEVIAELPGVDQKDIEVDLADDILTLKAECRSSKEEKDEKKHYHLVERAQGTYMRRFSLPFEADADKVEADFDKGVLRIFVPRSAEAEKHIKKITVKGH